MGIFSWLMSLGCESINVRELKAMRSRKEDFFLPDVRTPEEYKRRKIEGAKLIPVQELGGRMKEVPKNKNIIVYCASGVRSAFACRHLKKLGYSIKNLSGGIGGY